MIVNLCCLNVGVCSTAQAIVDTLNQFIEKHALKSGAVKVQNVSNFYAVNVAFLADSSVSLLSIPEYRNHTITALRF